MSNLRNPNVTELLAYCSDGNQRVLAYEYAVNGSLQDILHGASPKHCACPLLLQPLLSCAPSCPCLLLGLPSPVPSPPSLCLCAKQHFLVKGDMR